MNAISGESFLKINSEPQSVGAILELYESVDQELRRCADHAPSLDSDLDVEMETQEEILFQIQMGVINRLALTKPQTLEEAKALMAFWQEGIKTAECADVHIYHNIAQNVMSFYVSQL